MEYQQITLTEWQDMKKEIERDLLNVKLAFVRIGYNLRRIEEKELYRQDGYKTIAEFAKEEYGLGASTVSRFIAINRRFSIGGNSQFLDNRYTQYSSSALQEMLTLPDNDLEMITPETKRETIRELKKFNAEAGKELEETEQEPAETEQKPAETEQKPLNAEQEEEKTAEQSEIPQAENAENAPAEEQKEDLSPLEGLIINFFEENPKILDRLYKTDGFPDGETAVLREIVNPSGSRSVRNGAWIMIMNESDIKWKRFGGKAETLSWEDFMLETDRIYAAQAAEAGNDNILGWKKKAEGSGNEKTGDKKVDQKEAERAEAHNENGAGGAGGVQDPGQETDGSDPGESDDQLPEKEKAGGENLADRDPDEDGRETAPADGGTEQAGDSEQSIAPAQKQEETPKSSDEENRKGQKDDLKERLISTANLLLSDLQNEDWQAAEHHMKFLEVWLQEIREE